MWKYGLTDAEGGASGLIFARIHGGFTFTNKEN